MGADNPSETEHSPVASRKEQTRQILVWAGYFCGAMAFLFWPIILGPAGIIIGVVNRRRGEKRHGQQQIGLGALGLIIGLVIGALVNSGFASSCTQTDLAARTSSLNANIQRMLSTPGQLQQGLGAQNLFVEQAARMNAAMLRDDMQAACAIMDDLERRIR
jgi:hypothetical protein